MGGSTKYELQMVLRNLGEPDLVVGEAEQDQLA
jgi:hypothetical protein